ncbi:MAG: hypothetical protein HY289_13155 [Planctomycetes bacterium]|nr:hypothetical protein [Planctomycetota bacterium]
MRFHHAASLLVVIAAAAFLPAGETTKRVTVNDGDRNIYVPVGDKKQAPPAPKEFAFVLSDGYGEADRHSSDPKVFENLLINMRKSGFNTLHCVYRDWRVELCRKHKVKMMIDVLAWKEGAEMDIRKPEQRAAVKKICEAVRGNDAVWGYNLWNETLSFFGNPDGKNIDAYCEMLKEWDPTHPIWIGTRTVSYANALKSKPGVHGYYDYPWQRGFNYHFADLMWYYKHVPSQDGFIGRWEQGSNYNWNSFSLNTSIAFGTKVNIWFIGGPFDKEGNVDPKHRFHHLVKIGQETQKLYPELGKFGRPTDVFSTPTTRTHDNKERDKTKDKSGPVPWNLPAFPKDFWFEVRTGEALAGFFRYENGDDAIFIANHNAFAKQDMTVALAPSAGAKARIEIFSRETGVWRDLVPREGIFAFEVRPGGGELLRVQGRAREK